MMPTSLDHKQHDDKPMCKETKDNKDAHLLFKCFTLAFHILQIFKYGIEPYIDKTLNNLHNHMLKELKEELAAEGEELKHCTSCDTPSSACVLCIRVKIYMESLRVDKKIKWEHTNTRELSTSKNHWEYAKVFMHKYCDAKSAKDTHLPGLLTILILHADLKYLSEDGNVTKIRDFNNHISNSGSSTCGQDKLEVSIDIMIEVLEGQYFWEHNEAKWAKDRLLQIKFGRRPWAIAAVHPFEEHIDILLSDLLKGESLAKWENVYSAFDKVALLIVNADYKKDPIHGARTSLLDLRRALENLDFRVISLLNVTKREFENAMEMFSILIREGTYVFFYYNGHGKELDKTLFLLPIEDDISGVSEQEQYVALDDVMDRLKRNYPQLICMIPDNCRWPGEWSKHGIQLPSNGTAIICYATTGGMRAYGDNMTTWLLEHLIPLISIKHSVGHVFLQLMKEFSKPKYKGKQVPEIQTNMLELDRSLADPISDQEEAHMFRTPDWINDVPETKIVVFPKVRVQLSFQSNIANVLRIYSKVANKGNTDKCKVHVTHEFADVEQVEAADLPGYITSIHNMQKIKDDLVIQVIISYTKDEKVLEEKQSVNLGKPLVIKWNLSANKDG